MKRIIILLIAFSTMISLNATPVSRADALKIASNYMKTRIDEKSLSVETIREVKLDRNLQLDYLYIFTGEHSYVILSADDRAMPVLGYSLDRPFEGEDLPINLLSWLQGYDNEIRYLVEHEVDAAKTVKEAWEALSKGELSQPVNRAEVKPLIKTSWGQHAPFNYSCPGDCVTGCVATAMSQIMKYWEYPNRGTGSHSYFHSTYGTLQANFENTIYDWDHMPFSPSTSSSLVEKTAIGTLIYHCGVAVEMNYGTDVSSAYSDDVPDAMIHYFGYNPETVIDEKQFYSDAAWKTLIKDELNQSRPVYYSGNNSTNTGGHAFICDGYDNQDYFSFNWGWTGNYNGYYMIGSLNPDNETDLNYRNRIITGLYPASYTIDAPMNLNATVEDMDVHLSWSASSGASYYNVYRNGELIAAHVNGTSYVDTDLVYGNYTYYVKALKSNGDRSPRSSSVVAQILYAIPAPVEVAGQFYHDNASLTLRWSMPTPQEAALSYGTGPYAYSSYGYNGAYPTYWAQRYPVADIIPYAGMYITAVNNYFRYTGDYLLYIYAIDDKGAKDLIYQQAYSCVTSGENEIVLSQPVALDYQHDLWVGFYAPETIPYPATYCDYYGAGLGDASYISLDGSSWNSHASDYISWMFEIIVESPEYKYKITKNGTVVASQLTESVYQDRQLTSGTSTYQVQASYDGETSKLSEECVISLAEITTSVNNTAGGTVDQGGLYQQGDQVTLRAFPNTSAGYHFKEWKEDGVTVSTNKNYSFQVIEDRSLTACFQKDNGVEDLQESFVLYPNPVKSQLHVESSVIIRQVELITLDGVTVASKEVNAAELDYSMADYARGVYYIRLVTDEGVIMKKVVLNE